MRKLLFLFLLTITNSLWAQVFCTTTTSTTNVTVCPSQLPYIWNYLAYDTAGTYSVTLPNAGGCDSIATLVLTVKPPDSSTTNMTICPSQLPYTWNGIKFLGAGSNFVVLSSTTSCDSIATLNKM